MRILVVDDEASIRDSLREILESEGFQVDLAGDGMQAFQILGDEEFDLVLSDIKMPRMDGIELLTHCSRNFTHLPIIMISAHGNVQTAVEATKLGAFDFITKPLDLDRLLITIRNALQFRSLKKEAIAWAQDEMDPVELQGQSPALLSLRETLQRVAPTDVRILISGQAGTGKEWIARFIHRLSPRNNGPFVSLNCATVPADSLELKLFGSGNLEEGDLSPRGYYNQALGGTLFLDEIADLPGPAQLTLVRLLESSKNQGSATRKGVRILAGSQKDLVQLIEEGKFRLDLYHLLSVILVHLPSLQQRREDIPLLSGIYLNRICRQYQLPALQLEPDAIRALQALPWTGNLRELKNAIERLAILAGPNITRKDIHQYIQPIGYDGQLDDNLKAIIQPELHALQAALEENNFQRFKELSESIFVEIKLREHQWNIAKTAEVIGIQRSHLYNKIDRYQLSKPKQKSNG
jgi:DNA-binding NtrC family response regulator